MTEWRRSHVLKKMLLTWIQRSPFRLGSTCLHSRSVRERGGDERGRCTSMTLLSHGLCRMRRSKLAQDAAPLWSTSPCFRDSAAFLIDELPATSLMAAARPGAVKLSIGRGAAAAPMACRRSAQNRESNMNGTVTEGMPAHSALPRP